MSSQTLPHMLDPMISSMSSSIFLLRDLILADTLPHFQASPEVKYLLQTSSHSINPEALNVLLEAAQDVAFIKQTVIPTRAADADSFPQSSTVEKPLSVLHKAPRILRKIPCRNKVTVRCEDSWQDTFHNAEQLLPTINIASGQSIFSQRETVTHRDNESMTSFDENDYYSSHWDTSDGDSTDDDQDSKPKISHGQYEPLSGVIPVAHPTAHLQSTIHTSDSDGFVRNVVVRRSADFVSTADELESDYAPPSVESAGDVRREPPDVLLRDSHKHDDYSPRSATLVAGSEAHIQDINHRNYRKQDVFEARKYPSTSEPTYSSASKIAGAHAHKSIHRPRTGMEEGPPKKRRRNERKSEYYDTQNDKPGQGVHRPTIPQEPLDHISAMATASQPSTTFIPAPPDLAAIQAYANHQAQMHLQQQPVSQQIQNPGMISQVSHQVAHPLHASAIGLQYPQPPMATTYPAGIMNMPQQQQVANTAPPGYILVRDQFGNAWYARPLQQPVTPIYGTMQTPFM